jgi:hypothetical protein
MLSTEEMIVQVRNPLAARDRETQILFPLFDMGRNVAPIKLRILFDEVSGT